eukprot:6183793-Pleurochrysis_carterae.AAC.1
MRRRALSSVPYFLQQVAVSPPPMTVTTPLRVASTIASIIDLVPASKEAISKTPIGPVRGDDGAGVQADAARKEARSSERNHG